jgi:hypothetical protein
MKAKVSLGKAIYFPTCKLKLVFEGQIMLLPSAKRTRIILGWKDWEAKARDTSLVYHTHTHTHTHSRFERNNLGPKDPKDPNISSSA